MKKRVSFLTACFLGIFSLEAESNAAISWRSEENKSLRERLDVTEKTDCRYLDFDGDGFDEVLFPLAEQAEPFDSRYPVYGVARRNAAGEWVPLKKKGTKKESDENLVTMRIGYANSFVAFDDSDWSGGVRRVFAEMDSRYGISGFSALTQEGFVGYSREQILRSFGIGEFDFLKRLKIIRERSDFPQRNYGKERALRLTNYGNLHAYSYADTSFLAWMYDTQGGRFQAVPLVFFTFPMKMKDIVAGVVLPREDETRVGILFKEELLSNPDLFRCEISGKDRYKLLADTASILDWLQFLDKKHEKIFTEFFPDNGALKDGEKYPVIWAEISPETGAHRIVSYPFCEDFD